MDLISYPNPQQLERISTKLGSLGLKELETGI